MTEAVKVAVMEAEDLGIEDVNIENVDEEVTPQKVARHQYQVSQVES